MSLCEMMEEAVMLVPSKPKTEDFQSQLISNPHPCTWEDQIQTLKPDKQ